MGVDHQRKRLQGVTHAPPRSPRDGLGTARRGGIVAPARSEGSPGVGSASIAQLHVSTVVDGMAAWAWVRASRQHLWPRRHSLATSNCWRGPS